MKIYRCGNAMLLIPRMHRLHSDIKRLQTFLTHTPSFPFFAHRSAPRLLNVPGGYPATTSALLLDCLIVADGGS